MIDQLCKLLDHSAALIGTVGTALAAYAAAKSGSNAQRINAQSARLDAHGTQLTTIALATPPAAGPSAAPLLPPPSGSPATSTPATGRLPPPPPQRLVPIDRT